MRVELFSPMLLIGAIATSLFFVGFNIETFGVAMLLLLTSILAAAWGGYRRGWSLPLTPLAWSLSLYWLWLAFITLAWGPAPFISTVTFWWMSCLPLGFWLYWLMPERDKSWRVITAALVAVALTLVVAGVYQVFVLQVAPQTVFLDVNIQAAVLNLIAMPIAGIFLGAYPVDRRAGKWTIVLGAVFVLLAYGVFLTKGRGGIASFLSALILLAFLGRRYVPKDALLMLVLLTATAFGAANLSWSGGLVERLGTLSDVHNASIERLLIWEQSLELLRQSPFWGLGLGVYALYWPPYRDPRDLSAGYFVHNDYLQMWIETGLPGLLLFLAVLGSLVLIVRRLVLDRGLPTGKRLEAYGLFAGMVAISMHGFVQYNFYVVPILIVFGLFMGRMQDLARPPPGTRILSILPAKHFSIEGFRLITLGAILLPGLYFASVGLSAHMMSQGVAAAQHGELEQADTMLATAQRLWPDSDAVLIARADLHRTVLVQIGDTHPDKRQALFESARYLLDRAESRNPLRSMIYLVRAELFRQAPTLVGQGWAAEVDAQYRKALQLNPRYYGARYNYALFLVSQGDVTSARRVLDEGMKYIYTVDSHFKSYVLLTADLNERGGDAARASELRKRAHAAGP